MWVKRCKRMWKICVVYWPSIILLESVPLPHPAHLLRSTRVRASQNGPLMRDGQPPCRITFQTFSPCNPSWSFVAPAFSSSSFSSSFSSFSSSFSSSSSSSYSSSYPPLSPPPPLPPSLLIYHIRPIIDMSLQTVQAPVSPHHYPSEGNG